MAKGTRIDIETSQLTIRVSRRVALRAERLIEHVGRSLGVPATRTDVVREAILRGLDVLEREAAAELGKALRHDERTADASAAEFGRAPNRAFGLPPPQPSRWPTPGEPRERARATGLRESLAASVHTSRPVPPRKARRDEPPQPTPPLPKKAPKKR